MAVIIFPPATYSSEGSGESFANASTLSKLGTDANGNLSFNGKTVAERSIEVSYNITCSKSQISQKFIAIPNDCDFTRAITLSLNGVVFTRGDFWEVSEKNYPDLDAIVWAGLGLDGFIQVGDKVAISYYKKI